MIATYFFFFIFLFFVFVVVGVYLIQWSITHHSINCYLHNHRRFGCNNRSTAENPVESAPIRTKQRTWNQTFCLFVFFWVSPELFFFILLFIYSFCFFVFIIKTKRVRGERWARTRTHKQLSTVWTWYNGFYFISIIPDSFRFSLSVSVASFMLFFFRRDNSIPESSTHTHTHSNPLLIPIVYKKKKRRNNKKLCFLF